MHVILDRDRCAGLGSCESVAPDHFEIGDHGDLVVHRSRRFLAAGDHLRGLVRRRASRSAAPARFAARAA
jgi:ferredoxin